jgi:4-hydroxy-tetrahydrodipicolinate synthase
VSIAKIPDGVIAAVATPLTDKLKPAIQALTDHIKNLLDDGCSYASLFGTTGEGPSLGVKARMSAIDEICKAGISPKKLVPGTGAASLEAAMALTRHACELGVAGVLVFPPFYFPDPPFQGLMAYYVALGEIAARHNVPLIFYNYPRMTKVPVAPDLIKALRKEMGPVFAGVKDSSGDWEQTRAYLEIGGGFAVLPGSETVLPQAVPLGASGTITGFANVAGRYISASYDELLETGKDGPAQQRAWRINKVIIQHNLLPSQKYMLYKQTGNPAWNRLAPPLWPLDDRQGQAFIEAFELASA